MVEKLAERLAENDAAAVRAHGKAAASFSQH